MKKVFTTLVLLLACAAMSYAAAKTIYLNPRTADNTLWTTDGCWFALYTNGSGGEQWVKFAAVEGEQYIQKAVAPDGATLIIPCRMKETDTSTLSWDNKYNQTDNITSFDDNTLISITGWGQGDFTKGTYTLGTVSSVQLLGDWNWDTSKTPLTLTESSSNVYTGTLDLSETTSNQEFKLVLNSTIWMGCTTLTIGAADGLVDEATYASTQGNFILNNATADFKKYDITATWVPNSNNQYGWTLSIVGNTPRPRVYSICGTITGDDDSNWHTDWDMEATGEENEYQLVKELALTAGTYKYKLRTNANWDTYTLPAGTGNYTYTINDNGTYRFTWTANVSTHTLTVDVKKVVKLNSVGKGTFASNHTCDFSSVEGLSAYAISEVSGTSAVLTKVTGVPNGNGVILIGSANGKYYVPFGDAASLGSTNLLQAVTSASGYTVENNGDVYVLHTDGLLHPANAGTIPFGKAYLPKASVGLAPSLTLIFDNETTGISNIQTAESANGSFYNLAGQRIAQPTKSLYIVNGKKVVLK